MNYKSQFAIAGLPIIHISTGKMVNGRYKRSVAKGWIAIGDISFGVILSVGGIAFGGISLGGLAFGLFSFAGLAFGIFAFGGLSIGISACGGGAIAWRAAEGGLAVARQYAQGGSTIANHANDQVAKEFFGNSRFFSGARLISEHSRWFLLLIAIPIIQRLIQRKRLRREKPNT